MLGRESIRDHATAVLELVKNSYDADAQVVEIELRLEAADPFIRIADNGSGMTLAEVKDYWLRIGFSHKPQHRMSGRKRRRTGEKGVGRISADRLGARLELRTLAKKGGPVRVVVNWDDFDAPGKDLASVPIQIDDQASPALPKGRGSSSGTGTELIIGGLRQGWTLEEISSLRDELSILTPPFAEVVDFSVRVTNDRYPELNGPVQSPFLENAEIELHAEFKGESISYELLDRIGGGGLSPRENGTLEWPQLIQRLGQSREPSPPDIGPVAVHILYYPRASWLLEGTGLRLADLREYLDKNAGIRLYRDNVRVRPYGDPYDPKGDWLGLAERKSREPAAVSRPTFRAAANQVVGALFIGRDTNPTLTDSAGREGLIENTSFANLRALALGCLSLLETHRHERHLQEAPRGQVIESAPARLKSLGAELDVLERDLRVIKQELPSGHSLRFDRALEQMTLVQGQLESARTTIDAVMSQAGVLRGVATVGVAASVFGHEIQSAIAGFQGAASTALALVRRKSSDTTAAIEELEKSIRFARQVHGWGSFALTRIRRDKRRRRKIDVSKTIEAVVSSLKPAYVASDVAITEDLHSVTTRAFEMDIEAITINLLTNAYVACQQVRRERTIVVRVVAEERSDREGYVIEVGDSGPGVPKELRDRIWQPLFSTRRNERGGESGTGLGLAIIDSIVADSEGERNVGKDPLLKGALFSVWLPTV